MVEDFDILKLKKFNLCQLVVDELRKAVLDWQGAKSDWAAIPGCGIAPLLMYLDCIDHRKLNPRDKRTPRALFMNPSNLLKLSDLDCIQEGDWKPDSWIYGKLPVRPLWKSRGDIVFFDDVSRMTGGRLSPSKRSSSSLAAFQSPRRLLAAKDTLDLEAANIVHFQTSISHMRQSLCLFKASQDARCKPYEEQDQAYVKAMNDADLAAGVASSAAAAAGFPPVPDCAVVRPRSPVVANGSGLSHGDVTNNEDLPTADTPPCDDSDTGNTVTDVRQDDKDNFVDAMDDLGSGKDGAETFDEQEAPDGVKSPHNGEALKSGSVPAPATADVATAPIIPEVIKSDVVTAPLNAAADTVKVDAPPCASQYRNFSAKLRETIDKFFYNVTKVKSSHETAKKVMFENKFCHATVQDVSDSFNLRGMLTSPVAEVGIFLMREKYRGSTKLVVPFWVCRKIWDGHFDNNVRSWFTQTGLERMDRHELVVFPTFDPPKARDEVGHYAVVTLNLRDRSFQYIDSLYTCKESTGWFMFNKMTKNIKQLWADASQDMQDPLSPLTIDDLKTEYLRTLPQDNGRDCGFFMLQTVGSWNGESLDLDEENLCVFDTQTFVPEADVVNISSQDDDFVKKTGSKSLASLKNKLADVLGKATDFEKKVVDAEAISSDDDFVRPKTRSGKVLTPVKKRKDPSVDSANITTTRRAPKRPKKWSGPVEILKPGEFKHLKNARLLKDFMLSKHAVEKYGSVNYCRFVHGKDTFGDDIESLFTGEELATAFGALGELEGEMMSYIICQWKEDPTQNHVFASGTRVLLPPYFLTYLLEMDGMTVSNNFDVVRAVQSFHDYLKPGENLLTAKLIIMPYCNKMPGSQQKHHVLYVMNKYRSTFDVLDSFDWSSHKELSRSSFHAADVKEIARVDDWKAEYLYSTVFHVNNMIPLHDLPVEIQCLSPHSVLSTQGEELIMMLIQIS
ncbi:hypothetical protein ACQ4PT_019177 [Festuca glaucescens]